ncbi:uncharacterized protein LOC122079512 isoform X2 [Macadamia integrifolia]|uniref:uncharacterized protein LOC122079512 isoform X2 n=1 Tax=Macadamia integrifolia TaxID=60698 RepID=UPI001C500D75|nr:uncharacterized protein LOC122079512 isoform X2 [Macadamia integrifolia]
MSIIQSDLRSALHLAATFCYLNPISQRKRSETRIATSGPAALAESPWLGLKSSLSTRVSVRAFSSASSSSSAVVGEATTVEKNHNPKPSVCTADELHYVPVANGDWRLALWRYNPPPNAPPRNHPLLLLSGVGTNAIGYDLSHGSSFARYMSSQGYDTWILEVRGAGLSTRAEESKVVEQSPCNSAITEQIGCAASGLTNGAFSTEQKSIVNASAFPESETSAVKGNRTDMLTPSDESQLVTKLTETLMRLSERLSGFLSEGLLEARQNSAIAGQIRDLSQRLVNIIEEGQRSVSPQLFDLRERFTTTIEDFQKQLDLIVKYDWDFDNYLEEDIPAVMEYIRSQGKPKDGKLLAIGHSMGGILLYAMLSRSGFEGRDSGLAAVVTLASSLDYSTSNSSLKLLLPLADPAQALSVPVVPLGVLLAAAYPLSCHPPYVLSWLNPLISAQDMMHPELFEKLVLNNFCTIPAKLLLQLTTAFQEGGLRDRSGTFLYKDHLCKSNVPVLALAGDQDLICPPEAVYETVKIIPQHLVTYKIFGEPGGAHYAHYDLVGGRLASDQVYPCIIKYLNRHDVT